MHGKLLWARKRFDTGTSEENFILGMLAMHLMIESLSYMPFFVGTSGYCINLGWLIKIWIAVAYLVHEPFQNKRQTFLKSWLVSSASNNLTVVSGKLKGIWSDLVPVQNTKTVTSQEQNLPCENSLSKIGFCSVPPSECLSYLLAGGAPSNTAYVSDRYGTLFVTFLLYRNIYWSGS